MKKLIKEVILPAIAKNRDAGQKEYAQDKDNVFANFERIADALDQSREEVLMTYLLKHIDGIVAYVKGHKSQREDVTGRITDAIVYLMLLWAMTDTGMCSKCTMHRQGCSCRAAVGTTFVSNATKLVGFEEDND
jgi:hypothetical protein